MSWTARARCATTVVCCLALAACSGEGAEKTWEKGGPQEQAGVTTPDELPDTTGEAVWSFLDDGEYQENFRHWPDAPELHPARDPHGPLVTGYLNTIARTAVDSARTPLPEGSILVLEDYMPDSTLSAVDVMYRVDVVRYHPESDHWFFARYGPDGSLQEAGQVGTCVQCHRGAPGGSWVLGHSPAAAASAAVPPAPDTAPLPQDTTDSARVAPHPLPPLPDTTRA